MSELDDLFNRLIKGSKYQTPPETPPLDPANYQNLSQEIATRIADIPLTQEELNQIPLAVDYRSREIPNPITNPNINTDELAELAAKVFQSPITPQIQQVSQQPTQSVETTTAITQATPTATPQQPVETQATPTATVEDTQPEKIADKAMYDAVKQEQLDFAAKRAAEGIADESYPLIAQIVKFQNDWQAANAKGDAEGMKAAHDGAEGVRRIAKVRGIDLGQWDNGGNFSAEQSNFALYNYGLDKLQERQDKFKSVQDDLKNRYALSSQQYYDDRLDYYRSRGVPYGEAVIRAGRETLSYQKDRTGFLQDAIDTFGIDNGTTMNQFGISALGQLATEDNIMGSAYANAYAKPLNEYNYNNAMQQLMATQAAAMQRQNARNQYDWTKTQYKEGEANKRNERNNATSRYNTQYREESENARTEYKEKNKFALEQFRAKLKEIAESKKKKSGSDKNSDKETYQRLKDLQTRIRQKWKDAKSESEPDEEFISNLSDELNRIDEMLQTYQDPSLQTENYPEPTGDANEDIKIIAAMKRNGATSSDIHVWARDKYDSNTLHKMIDKIS